MSAHPLLLGHRGARRVSPENTLAAFTLALEHGCHGFEFDVRRTCDAKSVICHDARYYSMDVARTTLAALRKRAEFPTLNEVISRFGGRAFLDIELKIAGLEQAVADAVAELPRHRFVISSFLPNVLARIRLIDLKLPTGLIFDRSRTLADWRDLPIHYVIAEQSLAAPALVREAHAHGKRLFVWTVNRQADMLRLRDSGVDGIISDDTELLCRTLHHP
ncbi:MAG TPA: glycerophosphodiester phosphodiesterase [Terriglobales bacterium]|nr:glycerophosphodiester phosphodiesterase [Terriglobales bacterium]